MGVAMSPVRTSNKARLNIAESKMCLQEKTQYCRWEKFRKKDANNCYIEKKPNSEKESFQDLLWRSETNEEDNAVEKNGEGSTEDENEKENRLIGQGRMRQGDN